MEYYVKVITTATGAKQVLVPSVDVTLSRVDRHFTTTQGQTVIQLVDDLGATQMIDVYENGIQRDEGETHDYTRDVDNDQIIFNSGREVSAKIKVVLYV